MSNLFLLLFFPVLLSSLSKSWALVSPFHTFQFAPNGVCVKPSYFTDGTRSFTMRNVPGTGDCMFLAVALATSTSMGLGGNDALLRAISRESRHVVAQILSSPEGNLFIEGQRFVRAKDLLMASSQKEGITPEEYVRRLRLEGSLGGLYGGGPELTVLSNVLRRPISIYELSNQNDAFTNNNTQDQQNIRCCGVFGAGVFDDPCKSVPHSAVLAQPTLGAYSWHLHILVVDVGHEKHACVLLPQEKVPQTYTESSGE